LMEKKSARRKKNVRVRIGEVAISAQNMDSFLLPMISEFAPTAEKAPAAACMDFVRNVPVSWEGARCVGGNGRNGATSQPF
jgi:hypothetical protein